MSKNNEKIKRLANLPTLRIDPDKPIGLIYRKNKYTGLKGDTIATAMYANGIRIFSRSMKYHRPRGLYSLGGETANCLMRVNQVPNVNTEYMLLREGMQIEAQNVKGSAEHDLMGFVDYLDWAMPAGFYYRHFHKPYKLWPAFMQRIRKTAGIGVIDPDFKIKARFERRNINTDVCVIGGGPAGICAALSAAQKGLRVVLIEALPYLGGCFDHRIGYKQHDNGKETEPAASRPLFEKIRQLAQTVWEHPQIRVFPYTHMIGFYDNHLITAVQKRTDMELFDERYLEIRTRAAVVTTGCIERPLIFDNNDRPQIMQVNCAHRLAHTFGILPGKRAVFSVEHDLGLEAAIDLHRLGVDVICVADSRPDGQDPELVAALEDKDIPLLRRWVASKAYGTRQVKKVRISSLEGTRHRKLECDLLVASAGLTPCTEPLALAGAKLAYDFHTGFYLPQQIPQNIFCGGRLLGFEALASIETSGELAGLKAVAACGLCVEHEIKTLEGQLAELPGPPRGSKLIQAPVKVRRRFVDIDEDVTLKHIDQACHMGFDAVELAKRFTASGTGPGQGKYSGHNLPLVIAQYKALSSDKMKPTTVRPPLYPTLLSTYAGKHQDIFKTTPVHDLIEQRGGIFRRVGDWKRARYFSQDHTSRLEIETVRSRVGMIDVSTLGKFRIFGPDALKALERVYVSDMTRVSQKKLSYSAMCNEDGCLIDDGVIFKQADNDYYFTTSTGRAGATIEWIRYHTRFEAWKYYMVNLTDTYGAINLAGPYARDVLSKLTDTDLSNETLPFMGVVDLKLAGQIPARVLRLGFVGELSYELHIPSSMIRAAWELIEEAGREFNISPFGLEAQNVLRMEKGHVIIGQESEIRTTLHDLGLGFLWHRNKPEAKTVGAVALRQTEHQPDRLNLVGFEMVDSKTPPKDGSIIVNDQIMGFVCTARYSFSLEKAIGLALVDAKLAGVGTSLNIYQDNCQGNLLTASVVKRPFYDPAGERMKNSP